MNPKPLTRILVVAAFVALGPARAFAVHDPDVSTDELKCQYGTTLAIGKFVSGKSKCIASCQVDAFQGEIPASDCVPPYAGETAGCVQKTEAKTIGIGKKKCALDCPECYTGGDCMADMEARVADAEAQIDAEAAVVYCDDSGSGDGLTAAEAKCQLGLVKALGKYALGRLKYLGKCLQLAHKGAVAVADCGPPPTEPTTVYRIDRLEQKTLLYIGKYCDASVNPDADKPDCGNFPAYTSADWVDQAKSGVDGAIPDLFCGSPSGAFLD